MNKVLFLKKKIIIIIIISIIIIIIIIINLLTDWLRTNWATDLLIEKLATAASRCLTCK